MSPRSLGLTAGAVIILGGLIYLFVQVQADPAPSADGAADVTRPAARTPASPAEVASGSDAGRAPAGSSRPARIPTGVDLREVRAPAAPAAPVAPVAPEGPAPDVDFEAALDEANKHYDHGDYESAYKQAVRNLDKDPTNVRMLRVAVSSACMMGDADAANRFQSALPHRDQMDMARRCERANITLPVAAPAADDRREMMRRRAAGP